MNRRFLRLTFEREAVWMIVWYVGIPFIVAASTILVPGLLHAWR